MNNTMKRRMIAFVAAIAAVVSLSGCDDNYDETPPWVRVFLRNKFCPAGDFSGMGDGGRSQAKKMNSEAFWKGWKNC